MRALPCGCDWFAADSEWCEVAQDIWRHHMDDTRRLTKDELAGDHRGRPGFYRLSDAALGEHFGQEQGGAQ